MDWIFYGMLLAMVHDILWWLLLDWVTTTLPPLNSLLAQHPLDFDLKEPVSTRLPKIPQDGDALHLLLANDC